MTERGIQPMVGASLVLWHSDLGQMAAAARSLAVQEVAISHVCVVVNDDPDAAVSQTAEELLRPLLPTTVELIVRPVPHNSGFAGGHNVALAGLFAAGCDCALVMNPDVVLESCCVAELVAHGQRRGVPMLAGPLLERATGPDTAPDGTIDTAGIRWTFTGRHLDALQGRPMRDAPTEPVAVRGISGAAMFVTVPAYRRLVDATGEFFDEAFVAYREDAELGLRAETCGIEMWIVPTARGRHVRTQRGTRRGDPHIDRLGVRNRFLIAFKHGRDRPGGLGAVARDVVVIAGVLMRERSSWPGLVEAWRLRGLMHDKRRRMRSAARSSR
jgi:GT2 family glycosyltransferase